MSTYCCEGFGRLLRFEHVVVQDLREHGKFYAIITQGGIKWTIQ